jgi:ribosomal protein S18 acetylase RimI-like enzyme
MNTDNTDHFTIHNYQPADEADVIGLWRECELVVPWNNPQTDIARKTEDSPHLFFVGRIDGQLVASCMAGYDGHRGWIYFLAVRKAHRRKGLATRMVRHVESKLIELGCPKLELMVRNSNTSVISFYRNIGFDPDPVMVLSRRLIEDDEHDFL